MDDCRRLRRKSRFDQSSRSLPKLNSKPGRQRVAHAAEVTCEAFHLSINMAY